MTALHSRLRGKVEPVEEHGRAKYSQQSRSSLSVFCFLALRTRLQGFSPTGKDIPGDLPVVGGCSARPAFSWELVHAILRASPPNTAPLNLGLRIRTNALGKLREGVVVPKREIKRGMWRHHCSRVRNVERSTGDGLTGTKI